MCKLSFVLTRKEKEIDKINKFKNNNLNTEISH